MPVFQKGTFSINLGFAQIGGEFDALDRQCAWEFYTELITRVSVRGKLDAHGQQTLEGEVWLESFDSLYAFFTECRAIARRYPVGKIKPKQSNLAFSMVKLLEVVIRPFLEKWQASYRFWWDAQSDAKQAPFKRQQAFPHAKDLLVDWKNLRQFCRQ